jgi:hypothetical protein
MSIRGSSRRAKYTAEAVVLLPSVKNRFSWESASRAEYGRATLPVAVSPLAALGVDAWWPDEGDPMDAPSRRAVKPAARSEIGMSLNEESMADPLAFADKYSILGRQRCGDTGRSARQ